VKTSTVNVVPSVPTMSGGGTQCGGTLNITATTGANGNGIYWSDNGSTAATRSVGTGTYYALTTSAAGCNSDLSGGVVVDIRQAAGNGQAPDPICSCAPGLNACSSGKCETTCGISFTICPGVTAVTGQTYDGWGTLQEVMAACTALGAGWHIPSYVELDCLCQHRAELPGGYISTAYWASFHASPNGSIAEVVWFSACLKEIFEVYDQNGNTGSAYARGLCVKN
jgi:hypothetical protein